MSPHEQHILEFLKQVVWPNVGKTAQKTSLREYNYFLALGCCLGKGTAALFQLSFAFRDDIPGLYSAMRACDSFRPAVFAQLMQKWGDKTTYKADPHFNHHGPLSGEDLAFWQEHGYVIVKNAISKDQAHTAAQWLMQQAGMDLHNPDTWRNQRRGQIWEEVYQHPCLEHIRLSVNARKAFEQLWQTEHIWPSIDRASINLPESAGVLFPGPNLHLDVSFSQAHYFKTQGMVYFNDVAEHQGAFTCCPGFHKHYPQWFESVKHMDNPNEANFSEFPVKHVAAEAGDLIIWHHWLPHGSSPNKSTQPRLAQYFNMASLEPCFV